MDKAKLQQFLNRIMGINAPVIDIFGGGMPGIGGSAVITQGALNAKNDVVIRMRHQVADFAREYANNGNTDALKQYAQQIEGSLLVLQTMSAITEDESSALIDTMHDLYE